MTKPKKRLVLRPGIKALREWADRRGHGSVNWLTGQLGMHRQCWHRWHRDQKVPAHRVEEVARATGIEPALLNPAYQTRIMVSDRGRSVG